MSDPKIMRRQGRGQEAAQRPPVSEPLEPRLLLNAGPAPVPIAEWNGAGVHISIYDVAGAVDVDPNAIFVNLDIPIAPFVTIKLGKGLTGDGLGIVISGSATSVSVKDKRRGPAADVAFIATDTGMGKVSLRSGVSGYDLNGLTMGGLTFAADIDGDGQTEDKTGIYARLFGAPAWGSLYGGVQIAGDCSGDVVAFGEGWWLGLNRRLCATSLVVSGTMNNADIRMFTGIGSVRLGAWNGGSLSARFVNTLSVGGKRTPGNMSGANVYLSGQSTQGRILGKMTVSGLASDSLIDVHGPADSVTIASWGAGTVLAVGVDPGTDGVYFTADDVPTGGRLNKVTVTSHANSAPDVFGVIADRIGTARTAGVLTLPYVDGQFHITEV